MNYPKYIFLLLILAITFQTACGTASRAEQSETKNAGDSRNSVNAGGSEKQSSALPLTTPKPTPKLASSKSPNAVCGDPAKPCSRKDVEFDKWELIFQMPARLTANKTYSSASFYAVIVKQYADGCSDLDENEAAEPERLRLQKRFPANKVFAEYSCPNLSAVYYEFDGKRDKTGETVLYMDYIAVYAGDSIEEAKELRDELSTEFPKAEVKKMTANFEIIEQ